MFRELHGRTYAGLGLSSEDLDFYYSRHINVCYIKFHEFKEIAMTLIDDINEALRAKESALAPGAQQSTSGAPAPHLDSPIPSWSKSGPVAEASLYAMRLDAFARRRHLLSTLWLLGASYQQLATLHNITKPSVWAAVNKTLGKSREAQRHGTKLSVTGVAWYTERYQENEALLSTTPDLAADWLLDHTPFQGD